MKILSWNVLYIIHEINYAKDSYVLDKYDGNEEQRMKDIVHFIKEYINNNCGYGKDKLIICLQEVPCDVYNILQCLLDNDWYVIGRPHQRIPKINKTRNKEMKSPYKGKGEYLVTIVSKEIDVRDIRYVSFIEENRIVSGKGSLFITIESRKGSLVTIANCHLSYMINDRVKSLIEIGENIKTEKYIVIGDMNCTHLELKDNIKGIFDCGHIHIMDKYTMKRCKKEKKPGYKTIDHVISNNIIVNSKNVFETYDISDHNPIEIEFNI